MYKYINNYKCMPPVSMSNQHKTEKKNIVHLCNYYNDGKFRNNE